MTTSGLNTLVLEPLHFSLPHDQAKSTKRYRALAEELWREQESKNSAATHTKDYADGFRDGVVDYLAFGGNGAPPLLPPRRYWRSGHRLSDGPAPAENWFLGFAEGARIAAASGLREATIVSSSSGFSATYPTAIEVLDPTAPPESLPPPDGVLESPPDADRIPEATLFHSLPLSRTGGDSRAREGDR